MDNTNDIEEVAIQDLAENEDSELSLASYKITSYGVDFTVDGLVSRLKKSDIVIPQFQRNYVWNKNQASRFIESLLLGLPVPGIFLSKDDDRKLVVIDGQQRLRSLEYFYKGLFDKKVFELDKVVRRFVGKTYDSLEEPDRRQLDDSVIHATIVQQVEPDDDSSIYHIFERLNTGGTKLNPQEIRASIYAGPFNDLLVELNRDGKWREVFGVVSRRGKDQELILRFLALYHDLEEYRRPLNEFLNSFMRKHRRSKPEELSEFHDLFLSTISIVYTALGDSAFRPEGTLNAAVFDSVMLGIAKNREVLASRPEVVRQTYEELLKNEDFIKSYTRATTDNESLRKRISLATEAFATPTLS